MKTIYITERDDDNTKIWYLTDAGDLIEDVDRDDYPGSIKAKVMSHGMYPGSVDEWRAYVLASAIAQLSL